MGKLASNRVDMLFEYSPEALRQGLELSPRRLKLCADAYSDFPARQYRLPATSYQTFLRNTRLQTHSEHEVEKVFARCVFNVVFNNRDEHVITASCDGGGEGDFRISG